MSRLSLCLCTMTMEQQQIKKRKRPVVDEEEGIDAGALGGFNGVSVFSVLKYVLYMFAAVMFIHYSITIGHVVETQRQKVIRYRQAATDELAQPCCRIFYEKKGIVPSTSSAGGQLVVYVDEDADKDTVQRCQRILAEDKSKRGVNRCESALDILVHWFSYQVALETWHVYFPFADMAFGQYIVMHGMNVLTSAMSMFFLNKFAPWRW